MMLSGSEQYYDDIYDAIEKDYVAEATKILAFIKEYKQAQGSTLLDVACGTGRHATMLCKEYKVQGVDINANMLKIARKKLPGVRFTQGDMRSFDLYRQFDVVTCLFSAIGYMTTKADLQTAVKNMSRHLALGGVLLIEPWLAPDQWRIRHVTSVHVNKPDIKIVRMSHSGRRGRVSVLDLQYLIGTSKGIEHIQEQHELGLFTHEEYMNAFTKAGLIPAHDPEGIFGRGLYIGTKPTS
jgi:ubiquinone/menaquinone biosynthesis C-methylase UbiE